MVKYIQKRIRRDGRFKRFKRFKRFTTPVLILAGAGLAFLIVAALAGPTSSSKPSKPLQVPSPEAVPPPQPAQTPTGTSSAEQARQQIIVKYKPEVTADELTQLFGSVGASEVSTVENLRIKVLQVPAKDRDRIIKQLATDSRLEFVEADSINNDDAE